MSGSNEKLTIRQWNTQEGGVAKGQVFVAMLNPGKYSRSRSVEYATPPQLPDAPNPESRIKKISADTLELDELVLDGTGIVDAPGSSRDVDGQVALLRRVLHDPVGDQNVRYAVVQVVWGSMSFLGRLTSMTVNYTLFSASGTPLRARVKLSFTAYEKSSARLAAGAAAPQARQIRLVGADSLPLLCFKAYNDPSLFQAVALFNGLTSIRRMAPGKLITLPKMP
jgi:hypothetical protein